MAKRKKVAAADSGRPPVGETPRPEAEGRKTEKVLIANRGEIAVRIIRACRELRTPCVAVYSEADRNSLPVLLADEAICIGPGPAPSSYLNIARILSAASVSGCTIVHPGYGFLSENPEFAEAVGSCGLEFVGPAPETMRLLGDKIAARKKVGEAGVPVLPGSDAPVEPGREAAKLVAAIGYPVLVKAAAGGGGKGMRVVEKEADLDSGIAACQAEAKRAFDDGRVYVEKYLVSARHIEIQVLADKQGNVVQLGERDCSAQRRHQKLLEESPAPAMSAELRGRLGGWAVAAARAAGYSSAGTVEFICDEQGNCYFMEMNARLQVEHPVTEMVTGVDIVHEQLAIAAGAELSVKGFIEPVGHAIECRIYAEDPHDDFRPSPGFVADLRLPGGPGVRVDTYLMPGCAVPPFYDPLVAKLVVWAPDREQAIARMERALSEIYVSGIATTVDFHRRLLSSPRFRKGILTTTLLDEVW